MKFRLLSLLLFSFLFTKAQTSFKPGYFISNGKKTECLIKDEDWKTNPNQFEYKLDKDSQVETRNKHNTKAFGIDGSYKYISALVEIDRSTDNVRRMGYDLQPEFETEKLFLKVILEGKASLYKYTDSNIERYFYNLENSKINQLVYKRYRLLNKTSRIAVNNDYKQLIFNKLKCDKIPLKDIENLQYKEKSLKEYFTNYNTCMGENPTYVETSEKTKFLNISIKGGLDFSSAQVVKTQGGQRDVDLGSSTNFRYGVETEFILPFRNNKWSIFLEPSLRSSSGSASEPRDNIQGGILNAEFQYKSFELPIGARYYIYLKEDIQLFVNAAYVFDFRSEDTFLTFSRADGSDLGGFSDLRSKSNLFVGAGVRIFERLSGEIRFYSSRPVLERFVRYSNTALVIGIRLL